METGFLTPAFVQRLSSSRIQNVLLCGCGGGFDFVHGVLLYPELKRLGKTVIIGSYSFGRPENIGPPAETAFASEGVIAKRVSGGSTPDPVYCPEVHICSFLDSVYPEDSPHSVYAYYARDFTVPLLRRLYRQLVQHHRIDCIVLVDGGSDSLVVGDESGLGDPVEDAVSVTAVSSIEEVADKLLICVGTGADRYNHVSDGTTLRAIAELARAGGYLGCFGLDPTNRGYQFYRECIRHIYGRQEFQSVVAGMIIAATEGYYGGGEVPPMLTPKLSVGDAFYVWPLMSCLWAFEIEVVARRSLIAKWIADKTSVSECYRAISEGRRAMLSALRQVEDLPRQNAMASEFSLDYTAMYVRQHGAGDSDFTELEELASVDEEAPDDS